MVADEEIDVDIDEEFELGPAVDDSQEDSESESTNDELKASGGSEFSDPEDNDSEPPTEEALAREVPTPCFI